MLGHVKSLCPGGAASVCWILAASHDGAVGMCSVHSVSHRNTGMRIPASPYYCVCRRVVEASVYGLRSCKNTQDPKTPLTSRALGPEAVLGTSGVPVLYILNCR